MIRKSSPAAPFLLIKLRRRVEPAALLAEAAVLAGDDDAEALGVGLADAVLAVVLLVASQLQPAALHLAPRRLRRHRRRI